MFTLIVVRRDLLNNVAMKLLGILNGGILRRNLGRKLGKLSLLPPTDEEVIASNSNTAAAHVAKTDNPCLSKTYLTMNDAWIIDEV